MRTLSIIAGFAMAGMVFTAIPADAQETEGGIDVSRVIIPRAKILRVPQQGNDASQTATATQDESQDESTEQANTPGTGIETRPLEPLIGSSTGGGLVPIEDKVALTDPTIGVAQPLPFPADPSSAARVRVISPGQSSENSAETESTDPNAETAAVTPEDPSKPRWQRKRNRRFKLAPKGTEILDTTRPTYAVPITPVKTGLKQGARLRQLDKMTGQTVTYDLTVGESRRVDRLMVTLNACRASDNNASRGAMAFLQIWDTRTLGGDPNFTGWMFAESPALSALDHPRYDLWVINCTTSEAEVSTVSE